MLAIKTWQNGSEAVPAIGGRELHKALGVGRDFPTWINTRIESFGFIENVDFTSYLVPRGSGTPSKEYLLTLPMASELALLDKSEKGLELRRFILDQQSAQNQLNSKKICAEVDTPEKPMWELTLDDMRPSTVLKACPKCHTPHKNEGELCQACTHFDKVREQKAALVRQRNGSNVTGNELVQCLIERDGDTTMTVPGSFGTVITFQRNKWGHAVARVENPMHRANILKSIFYQSYTPPDQKEAA